MLELIIDRDRLMDNQLVIDLLRQHNHEIQRYKVLNDYYRTKHAITQRLMVDLNKPNNKLVANYAAYIADVNAGYFMGKPVAYSSKDASAVEQVTELYKDSDEDAENSELAKHAAIKGLCLELLYTDAEGTIRFKHVPPEEGFLVKSADVNRDTLYGVRRFVVPDYSADPKALEYVEVYDADRLHLYKYDGATLVETTDKLGTPHIFGKVPMVEFLNNSGQLGDFECILSLIDAYNLSQSDTANDFQYFTDAYLMLMNFQAGFVGDGCEADQAIVKTMRENKLLLTDNGGDAKWLIKDVNDAAVENYKTRLQQDIHRISNTPDLTDEAFAGNLSGVAMRFKLWGIDQNAVRKERMFRKGLMQRLRIIADAESIRGVKVDPKDIKIEFYRNVPQNTVELADMLRSLGDILSDKTRLEQLPFVDDVDAELARKKEEREEALSNGYIDMGAGDGIAIAPASPESGGGTKANVQAGPVGRPGSGAPATST